MNDENRAEAGTKISALCPAVRSDVLNEEQTGTELAKVAELCQRSPLRQVAMRAMELSQTEGLADAVLQGFSTDSTSRSQIRNWLSSDRVKARQDSPAFSGESMGVTVGRRPSNRQLRTEQELVRSIFHGELRGIRLEEMRTWQNEAMLRLQDLAAHRTELGPNSRPLSSTLDAQVNGLASRLLAEMSSNALEISHLESRARRWPAAIHAARESIRLRRDTAREITGAPLAPVADAHLQLAQALFMLKGNSPELRATLASANEEFPHSELIAYRFSQFHVMAGKYKDAYRVIQSFRNNPEIARDLLPLVNPAATSLPSASFPCNFYTYRHAIVDDAALAVLKEYLVGVLAWEAGGGGDVQRAIDEIVAAATSAAAAAYPVATNTREDGFEDDPFFDDTERQVRGSSREDRRETYDDVLDKRRRAQTARARINSRHAAARAAEERQRAIEEAAEAARTGAQWRVRQAASVGNLVIECLLLWNRGNLQMARANYVSASRYYQDCRRAILTYFRSRYPETGLTLPTDHEGVYRELVQVARNLIRGGSTLTEYFRLRYETLQLADLNDYDWSRPATGYINPFRSGRDLLYILTWDREAVARKLDGPLLAIAIVFTGLALAEANRFTRNYDQALSQCRRVIRRHKQQKLLSQLIEVPFAKILFCQILLEKGDAQYKSQTYNKRQNNPKYRNLAAASSYLGVLYHTADLGLYAEKVNAGVKAFMLELESLDANNLRLAREERGTQPLTFLTSSERRRFEDLAAAMPIYSVSYLRDRLSGTSAQGGSTVSLVAIESPRGEPPPRESNPVIFALVAEAKARLRQIEAGLNYLGYRDDYVPSWRFQFLLERSRYFATNAKNGQRDYLNFLNTAEDAAYREATAEQTVIQEKGNIHVEAMRVALSLQEVATAQQGEALANRTRDNAQQRIANFRSFNRQAGDLADEITSDAGLRTIAAAAQGGLSGGQSMLGTVASAVALGATMGAAVGPLGVAAGAIVGGLIAFVGSQGQETERANQLAIAAAQREAELRNLGLAQTEAAAAAGLATQQRLTAQAKLLVNSLEQAAALMRHEFALQNLRYVRNRTTDAELWFRLAHSIRGISERYLRYATELSFLAEQAYEFEAARQINVIRFDYELSSVGSVLAGDFLLADLDTLENDFITTQRSRQQSLRYIVSLAREYPEALQNLRETGATIITLSLRQLEERFPGVLNLRVADVRVLPVALMDPTRFSLQLAHLGISQVRLGSGSTLSQTSNFQSWLPEIDGTWPVKLRVTEPEVTVFSGLSRADERDILSFAAANQRSAFETLGAAASWSIDMSMQENQVVPESLLDILITISLSGYFDAGLRTAMDEVATRPAVLTQYISASRVFPDAFYTFHQTGVMRLAIDPNLLTVRGRGWGAPKLGSDFRA